MNTKGEARGAVRFLTVVLALLMIFGGLPAFVTSPIASAQDGGAGIDLGEPPVLNDVSLANATDVGEIDLATHLSVDVNSRASVRGFYQSTFRTSFPDYGFTGNVATCTPGTTSATYRQAVLDQIAWYRTMAGVPSDLLLSTTYNQKAQAAALIMAGEGALSHYPAQDWACWTQNGNEGAGNSNLAITSRYSSVPITSPVIEDWVTGYMIDPQGNNRSVGHRRWLLHPPTTTFGVGDATWFFQDGGWYHYRATNAIWVQDANVLNPWVTRDGFISWPPAGYVPFQTTFPRWHFTLPDASFTGATVTVTKDGVPYPVSIQAQHIEGYSMGDSISWLMSGYSENDLIFANPGTDDHYRVTISGVMVGGTSRTFTYDVVVFDPARDGVGALADVELSANQGPVGTEVEFTLASFPANSSIDVSWRTSSTTSVDLGSVTTNAAGSATGSFIVPANARGLYPVEFSTGSTTVQATFEITPALEVLTPFASIDGAVELRVTGFLANQVLWVEWQDPDDFVYYVQFPDLLVDANGQGTFTVDVPWYAEPGVQYIRVRPQYTSTTNALYTDDFVIVSDPPNAVAAGQTAYSTTTTLTDVDLDGSGSTGADGAEIVSWVWRVNGNEIASGEVTSAMLPLGVHTIELTVTDEFGLTDTDTLTVTISVAEQYAVADAGPDLFVPGSGGNGIVDLDGSASVAAPGTTITTYTWTRAGVATPIATGVSPTVSLPIGTHDITLTVTTNFNTTSTDVVTVVVGAPPVAHAGPDQSIDTYANTATVNLNGSGSTAGAGTTITGYQWTGLPGGTLSGATPSVSLPVGSHTATLTVTASNGMTATDTVAITIVKLAAPTVSINPERAAPVAKIDYTVTNFPRGSTVAITWTTNQGVTTSLGSVSFGDSNTAIGQISVPAGPGGLGNFLTFSLGSVSVSAEVDVAPRISPSETMVSPGQAITVNLRGFAPRDDVLIRWKVGTGWVNLGTTRTSSTGSVTNFPITVPLNADSGIIRVQGTLSQQSSAVTLIAPTVSIFPERTTVNNWVTFEISQFPANSPVQITWVRLTGSTINIEPHDPAQTDATGAVTGRFRVPATPGGPGQQIIFSSGNVSKTVLFEVAPRVKVTPAPAERGEEINISLRGFARGEAIRIRWRMVNTSTWIELATGTTSNTGSANIVLPVPAYAADGTYQLRAETASFNQQTNVVEIEGGGQVVPAAEVMVTPEPTPEVTTPVAIDRTALPLDAPAEIVAITDEAQTPEIDRLLTDDDLATGWSGTPDPIRGDARLTVDLGSAHTLRGFAWLTETGGCGELTGLEHSLDGETWTAFDPFLQPGPIGEGMVWRYQAATNEARFIRFAFAPETPEQTTVGCLAELAVWGTAIVTEEAPVETPAPTDVPVETPVETPTGEPVQEPTPEPVVETPEPVEPEPADEPVTDEPAEPTGE